MTDAQVLVLDPAAAVPASLARSPDALYLANLGVVIASGPLADSPALAGAAIAREPLRAYVPGPTAPIPIPATRYDATPRYWDDARRTWGLAAIGADSSPYTGQGAKVAVLDTGLDRGHPDFTARAAPLHARSFVDGEGVHDLNGHGTHCAGIVAGGSGARLRYAVAPSAALWIAKLFGESGIATDRQILAALDWVVGERVDIVSMSFETPTYPGQPFSSVYEAIARRALDQGIVLVAAAGNQSHRERGHVAPVSSPADCPSILAVGAIDAALAVAPFSNGRVNATGKIDVVAPGVGVFSSLPWSRGDRGYGTLSGTSQAAPHVTGCLALWREATGLAGRDLWSAAAEATGRNNRSDPLRASAADAGLGLIRAPGC